MPLFCMLSMNFFLLLHSANLMDIILLNSELKHNFTIEFCVIIFDFSLYLSLFVLVAGAECLIIRIILDSLKVFKLIV